MMMYEPPTTISPSRLQSFLNCPLQFKFRSLDNLESGSTLASIKGQIVHLALEMVFKYAETTPRINYLDDAVGGAWIVYQDDPGFRQLALDDKQQTKLRAEVQKLAANYFLMENADEVNAKGIELRLEVDLPGWQLRGIIDRLDEPEPGVLRVVDYKTGRSPSQAFEHKSLLGVNLYSLMCQLEYGVIPESVRLLYVKDKTTIISEPTERSNAALMRKVEAIRQSIVRACETGNFQPKKSALCSFCDYKPWCPAWDGNPDAIHDEYAVK